MEGMQRTVFVYKGRGGGGWIKSTKKSGSDFHCKEW